MDKDQARFILRSFRPDGMDCSDPEFAEALKLAHEDRELGQWLASERSFDAAFASALSEVKLPLDLCKNILAGITVERDECPQAEDSMDAAMIEALAPISPPPSLRGELLVAMATTAANARRACTPWWRCTVVPVAAAAGIALTIFLTQHQLTRTKTAPLPMDVVETGFIRAYESPQFSLDKKDGDHQVLMTNLEERSLPCPCCLPRGLAKEKGIGCRELVIDGKSGSLVCFDARDNGVVHLVVFRREDVVGDLPLILKPELGQHGPWSVARWTDGGKVFVLLGKGTSITKLASLF